VVFTLLIETLEYLSADNMMTLVNRLKVEGEGELAELLECTYRGSLAGERLRDEVDKVLKVSSGQ
jgi:hypothetical protein